MDATKITGYLIIHKVYILSYSADNVKQYALTVLHFISFQPHCTQKHIHEKAILLPFRGPLVLLHPEKKILRNIKDLHKELKSSLLLEI